MTLRIGIVGTGQMGRYHLERLAGGVPDAEVVAVSDVFVEGARQVAERVGARAYADGHELVADDQVEAVLIASPGDTHEEFTLACLAADKPVLCEKPLAPTVDACLRVLEAEAARPRRLVQVGFMRRYDDGFRGMKAKVEAGKVGRPLLLHCRHRNAAVPPGFTSEMMITDSVVHDIDVTRWLLGQEVVAATVFKARPSSLAPDGLQDPQMVLLETDEGVLVDVESFVTCQFGYDIRYELVAEAGTVALGELGGVQVRHEGQIQSPIPVDYRERFGAAYQRELTEWVAGVRKGEVTGPSAWDGYATTAVAEAAVESLTKGGRVAVELVERPALYA
ncbi:MAG TPA: Gfo/Idh/MocA family oxidoreductase [Actinomycetes bacterium]|jgi:myo-inositol 2-dehydrogenase/D-chiro-inositol 1-dehydrogenase|nr:Gfo/Idh/MocA family oxidoreductase [Actinomycetota bacterium]HEX2156809.1 Gfo/Idh/MocA family oxidoreductase [Actinomycetes bacterium]